ncbi:MULTISPECIES: type ISP restriction/modification enzyme [Winogradskyella]|uniref:type ISP restriction/modification enzyme n=1 Tax=Winogradskyella TaxID=286104 RepID=UPI0015BD07DA|nr:MULTISPECIES: type ISP restriction/modification enzyme [Winogradskyella]QXP77670.1 N-6 DNA methylase [Winogradskyella sp. HaHa_3_26]
MTIQEYITKINTLFQTGNAREHSYRGDLQNLIMAILPDVLVTNEPARVACGAPDYVLTRKDVPIGYIEAKDIGVDLKSKSLKEQFDRYKAGLTNLVFTDYLEFHFYKSGELTTKISIAKIEDGKIVPRPENFEQFTHLIENFAQTISQTIKSPTKLAEMMAGKAKLMADIIEKSLNSDDEADKKSNLKSQMLSFQQMLIHDINNQSFADIYAQTIAYGMFAARYHDPTLGDFTRTEAAQLIPKSNPFLRKLFQDIAGFDLDDRLVWIVDELVNIFLASDVADIMKNFGKSTKQEDPVVHFYETFLGEYNPALRKARGVWYTPEPVVNFIVRAVDDVLKKEFNLPQGLADTSKTKIKVNTDIADKRSVTGYKQVEKEVHKVQILDPATGTGTFLAEVVKHIHKKFKGQQGIWSNYVTKDLIPRLNGFELLMASYAMAHLKMDMLLTETSYKPKDDQRLKIFLTNSLEVAHPDSGTLFSSWLADESNQANAIKRDTPVMCVIGNPPYSGISSNNGKWISDLIDDYKYIDGVHFNERKHWLNDDYVKFMRFGQHFIEKNGEGILAFINPHGFLDNPTFRGMRWNLLKTYDKIYVIDLHGNSNKKEVSPDGSIDENVFDIQQGVSINIFVKKGDKQTNLLSRVFHYDLYGKRKGKYDFLSKMDMSQINWEETNPEESNFSFKKIDLSKNKTFQKGFKISNLFQSWTTGVQTSRDKIALSYNLTEANEKIKDFCNEEFLDNELRIKYFSQTSPKYQAGDTRDWKLNNQRAKTTEEKLKTSVINYCFRPFDSRKIIFNDDLISWSRMDTSRHLLKDNISLITARSNKKGVDHFFISKSISDVKAGERTTGSIFCPLYLYPDEGDLKGMVLIDGRERTPNLKDEIVFKIADSLNLNYTFEKEDLVGTFAPIDVLDYIYAVLHSPNYRETYKEFLKIDFPRVPYPKDEATFWKLVKLGGEIREIHLLESETVENYITEYPEDGDNIVTRKLTKSSIGYEADNETHGKVWINDNQYFDKVPLVAWEFYIGGYQPAQKWLKDRKDRELSFEDILHYQKIIVALTETDRLMKEIDTIDFMETKKATSKAKN